MSRFQKPYFFRAYPNLFWDIWEVFFYLWGMFMVFLYEKKSKKNLAYLPTLKNTETFPETRHFFFGLKRNHYYSQRGTFNMIFDWELFFSYLTCSFNYDIPACKYCKIPKYLDTQKLLILSLKSNKMANGKQCRPWSDCSYIWVYAVWSWSTLFAQTCLSENLGILQQFLFVDKTPFWSEHIWTTFYKAF